MRPGGKGSKKGCKGEGDQRCWYSGKAVTAGAEDLCPRPYWADTCFQKPPALNFFLQTSSGKGLGFEEALAKVSLLLFGFWGSPALLLLMLYLCVEGFVLLLEHLAGLKELPDGAWPLGE